VCVCLSQFGRVRTTPPRTHAPSAARTLWWRCSELFMADPSLRLSLPRTYVIQKCVGVRACACDRVCMRVCLILAIVYTYVLCIYLHSHLHAHELEHIHKKYACIFQSNLRHPFHVLSFNLCVCAWVDTSPRTKANHQHCCVHRRRLRNPNTSFQARHRASALSGAIRRCPCT